MSFCPRQRHELERLDDGSRVPATPSGNLPSIDSDMVLHCKKYPYIHGYFSGEFSIF